MSTFYQLQAPLGRPYDMNLTDVLEMKKVLNQLGLYEIPPHGLTQYPDDAFIEAIRSFQNGNGLQSDGVMKPDGPTYRTMELRYNEDRLDAQRLQSRGRFGDTILAHINPAEAQLLKRHGGSGTINPATGLLEFSNADHQGKTGSYIWRTQGDGKVRSSHADRDGKTFSWDNPPEGGHPGEAPNCRCTAEDVDVDCDELFRRIDNQQHAVDGAYKSWETIQMELEVVRVEQIEWQEKCDNGAIHAGGNIFGGAVDGYKKGKLPGAIIGGGIGAVTSAGDAIEACAKASDLFQKYQELKKRRNNAAQYLDEQRVILKQLWAESANSGCER